MKAPSARDLDSIRHDIDAVDAELARLFRQRMLLAEEVAEAKRSSGGAVYDPRREDAVLAKAVQIAGSEFENETRELFEHILQLSKARQRGKLGS